MEITVTLYTFPVSHFAEKVRWLFDYSGIPVHVVNWVPLVHAPAAYLKSGKRTVPFIEVSEGGKRFVVHDSTDIINWVAAHFEQLELMPSDEAICAEAMSLEDRADSVGDDVIRYMYAPMLEVFEDDFIQVWGWDAKPFHRRLLKLGLPVVRSLLDGHLDFSEHGRRAGLDRLHELFRELDRRLEGGRRFLVGEQLSIADISMASLLAPVYAPDTHPVYSSHTFRNTLTAQRMEFEDYTSFEWMQQLYSQYRSRKSETPATYIG